MGSRRAGWGEGVARGWLALLPIQRVGLAALRWRGEMEGEALSALSFGSLQYMDRRSSLLLM